MRPIIKWFVTQVRTPGSLFYMPGSFDSMIPVICSGVIVVLGTAAMICAIAAMVLR